MSKKIPREYVSDATHMVKTIRRRKATKLSSEKSVSNVVHVADVLIGADCRGKFVDMGFWFDIPHITKQTLKVLREKGAVGVRLVIEVDLIKELVKNE